MKTIDLTGKKFSRLTVLTRVPNPQTRKNDTAAYWLCKCDCGKEVVIRGYSLRVNKTKSCGCLNDECPQLNKYKVAKYSHEDSVLKKVWRRNNRYSDVPFEEFKKLIVQNCYYCGVKPELFKDSRRKESSRIYHGTLDRIDSNKGHTLDNVVPCCYVCNRGKSTRTLEEFKNYLNIIKNRKLIELNKFKKSIQLLDMSNLIKEHMYVIERAFAPYTRDKPGNLTMQQFYTLSNKNCYYCGLGHFNFRIYELSDGTTKKYTYNGLDRVDNNLPHDYENCVPCCKYCNSAKGELTLAEFMEWMGRFKQI